MSLVRSKQRVNDHGEVFTPHWLVEEMLENIKNETERVESRFLEPACGSGNFLVPVLQRKLLSVEDKFGKSEFQRNHYALLALMSLYGIELLADNVKECRDNLLAVFETYVNVKVSSWVRAAEVVLAANIVQGDALKMVTTNGEPINFPEWAYLGQGKYQRRDFLYGNLTQRSSFQNTLFEGLETHDVFTAARTYPKMSVTEIAQLGV